MHLQQDLSVAGKSSPPEGANAVERFGKGPFRAKWENIPPNFPGRRDGRVRRDADMRNLHGIIVITGDLPWARRLRRLCNILRNLRFGPTHGRSVGWNHLRRLPINRPLTQTHQRRSAAHAGENRSGNAIIRSNRSFVMRPTCVRVRQYIDDNPALLVAGADPDTKSGAAREKGGRNLIQELDLHWPCLPFPDYVLTVAVDNHCRWWFIWRS